MSVKIEHQVDLQDRNTLAVPCSAEQFCSVASTHDLQAALDYARANALTVTVLGGGSNVVLGEQLAGLCIYIALRGVERSGNVVKVAAGENWHETVSFLLEKGLFGLENLALIPGQVGAAPIQNIGAYGVDVAERITSVGGVDSRTGEVFKSTKAQCEFGYRDSVFKRSGNRRIITYVEFELDSVYTPRLEYAGILEQLAGNAITARNVFEAVCDIRTKKLPNPKEIGNAGSFFKNPVVTLEQYQRLKMLLPNLGGHELGGHEVERSGNQRLIKLSAAQLIESAGLKGRGVGGAYVSQQHSLVIENRNQATGVEVVELARVVKAEVEAKFDVELEIEPRVLLTH